MATHSSVLAWRIPGTGASWTAVYGVAQSGTQLKRLSSSSSSNRIRDFPGGSVVKNPPANAGHMGSILGSGRSPRVLEKTLESLLDSKEIKAVNPKGNQP